MKPSMSRQSNSEKYIICKDYSGYHKEDMNHLTRNFMENNIKIDIPYNFHRQIIEYNKLYTDNQIKIIKKGIELIKKNIKIEPTEYQIKKAIEWCKVNKIPINNNCLYLT